jgi:acyl-CoA synthetase (AMP-forming)/AMP-acid ligase II
VRIGLIGKNSVEYVQNLIDIWNEGNCAVLIDSRLPITEIVEQLVYVSVRKVVVSRNIFDSFSSYFKKWECIIYDESEETLLPDSIQNNFEESYSKKEGLILFSSGTSAKRKAIVLSHKAINKNADFIIDYMRPTKDDKIAIIKSCCHSSTVVGELLVGLKSKMKIIILKSSYSPRLYINQLINSKATIIGLNPIVFDQFTESILLMDIKMEFLKKVYVSGSKIIKPINYYRKIWNNVNIFLCYGLTEAGPRVSSQREIKNISNESVGRAIKNVKIKIVKEPKKRETEIKFSSWGLPFSYITKIPFNNKIKKENVYSNFLEFFDQNNELKNIGAINYLSKNIIEICKKIKIERRNYDCIDIFLFLYDFCLIQKRQVEFLKLSDLIEIINCILQNIELCKLLYARYIFKDDENYLIKIKERFDTIQIKYLELYDKMKANSQRFKKLI